MPWHIAGAEPPPKSVVFVAWNVRNYILKPATNPQGKILTPAKPADSIAAVVQTLVDLRPDIVGLCEMGALKDLNDLQRRLKKAGLDLPHRTWVDGPDRERHLALLSRFALASTQHVGKADFKLGGVSRSVQRGILDCTVNTGEKFPLRVLGVHLKSRRIVPDFDQAEFRRMESIVLREHLDAILTKNPAEPVLVFGDFNDTKNSPVIRGIAGRNGNPRALTVLPLADAAGVHDDADQYKQRNREQDERVHALHQHRRHRHQIDEGVGSDQQETDKEDHVRDRCADDQCQGSDRSDQQGLHSSSRARLQDAGRQVATSFAAMNRQVSAANALTAEWNQAPVTPRAGSRAR